VNNLLRAAAALILLPFLMAATWLQFPSIEADGTEGMTVTGLLRVPEGQGPFPAAVLLSDCDGISPHERVWGQRLADQGYVIYLIDSFFTRGVETTCGETPDVPVMDDLRGAIARLKTLPEVDASRIAVIGWQDGADVALAWAAQPGGGLAVVFYPSCSMAEPLARSTLFVLPTAYGGYEACNAFVFGEYEAGKTVQRIAPYDVGAGFDCQECAGVYLGGPGGWNDPADSLTTRNILAEMERMLTLH
jgi:hypothetical protein